ncbi:MAG: DNA primase catalytic subunit PriS [Candidatus Methanospirareceae archaeon]
MKEKTKKFMRWKFREYYKRARIKLPEDFYMREWGFILIDDNFPDKTVMIRHKAFNSAKQLINYLRENAPAHVYFSSALYNFPAAPMDKKGWLGADLIFDLDADHIVEEGDLRKYSYEKILGVVKEETEKLIDFLITDFGFSEDEIEVVFSGSRGYHIHISSERVRKLGSRERREIVDYVMGTGLEVERFLVEGEGGDLRILALEGWGKRLFTGLINSFYEITRMEEAKAIELLRDMEGIGEKRAKEKLRVARSEAMTERIKSGKLSQIPGLPRAVWEEVIRKIAVRGSKSDAPVTADIKRLIRMPTSLHAKTGLEVKPLKVEELKDFDPLEDAVVFADNKYVKVVAHSSAGIRMKGVEYKIEEGEEVSLPEHVALYFICRGVAEVV